MPKFEFWLKNGVNFEFVLIKRGEFWPNKKGWILSFDPVTSLKLLISPLLLGLFVIVARFARKLFELLLLKSVINWDKIKALQQNPVLNLNASE